MADTRTRDEVLAENFFAVPSPDEENLFDPDVVEMLVRTYIDGVVASNIAVAKGEMTPEKAAETLVAEANRLARIFTGNEPGYSRGPWHTPQQLGAVIITRHPVEPDPTKAAFHFFRLIGIGVLKVMHQYIDETMTERDAQFVVEAEIDAAKRTLMGWPAE